VGICKITNLGGTGVPHFGIGVVSDPLETHVCPHMCQYFVTRSNRISVGRGLKNVGDAETPPHGMGYR